MHHNADGAFGCEMNGRTWWVEGGLGALMKNLDDLKRVCQFGPVHRLFLETKTFFLPFFAIFVTVCLN